MPLLFDEDYEYLKANGIKYEEDEAQRFLIFKDFPLPEGLYKANDEVRTTVDVLYIIPPNYNTSGGDMFWVNPQLQRVDGKQIPNINGPGQDSRKHGDVEYMRWSRHWNNKPWVPKVDKVPKIVDRLTWAFANPDAKRT